LSELLLVALRARNSDAARNVLLTVLLMRLLADAGHAGPPHAAVRSPRLGFAPRPRLAHRPTLTGRRPRG
jgi:hypothetical protein